MIDEQLRAAVAESKLSAYALAKESGVSAAVLSRFLSGERDITLGTAAKLAHVLGLKLAPIRPKRPPKR